jgi:hypothetical protein
VGRKSTLAAHATGGVAGSFGFACSFATRLTRAGIVSAGLDIFTMWTAGSNYRQLNRA